MAEPTPVQFSLKAILAITAAVALFFASGSWFGPGGYVGIVLLTGLVGTYRTSRDLFDFVFKSGIYLSFVAITSSCFWPLVHSHPPPSSRSMCISNLKIIGLGLQNYADVYNCFPPVYTTDENGKPMHSWRVFILPFIEHEALYELYDLNEPWDGPHNSQLANLPPSVFLCPGEGAIPDAYTDYVAVVGPETIWQPGKGTKFEDIKDGSPNTIAVIEASGAGINWMEPRDLPYAALDQGINPKQGAGISSMHPGAVIAVFADGHTQTIQENISPETLKALFTKDGCEEIEGEF